MSDKRLEEIAREELGESDPIFYYTAKRVATRFAAEMVARERELVCPRCGRQVERSVVGPEPWKCTNIKCLFCGPLRSHEVRTRAEQARYREEEAKG